MAQYRGQGCRGNRGGREMDWVDKNLLRSGEKCYGNIRRNHFTTVPRGLTKNKGRVQRSKINISGEATPQLITKGTGTYNEFPEFSRKQIKYFTETFKKWAIFHLLLTSKKTFSLFLCTKIVISPPGSQVWIIPNWLTHPLSKSVHFPFRMNHLVRENRMETLRDLHGRPVADFALSWGLSCRKSVKSVVSYGELSAQKSSERHSYSLWLYATVVSIPSLSKGSIFRSRFVCFLPHSKWIQLVPLSIH